MSSPKQPKQQFSDIDRGDSSKNNIKAARRALWLTGMRRYRVIYLKGKKEYQSCWLQCRDRANRALEQLTNRGYQAIIYID